MDTSLVLIKTSKGAEEIKRRSFGVPQTVRALLIMVDGATSAANLLGKMAQLPKAPEHLEWLLSEGFVESVMPGQRADGSPPSVQGSNTHQEVSHKQALIALTRSLLGNQAAKVVQRLEDAEDSRAGLMAAVDRCHKFIKLAIDEDKANSFLKAGHAVLAKTA